MFALSYEIDSLCHLNSYKAAWRLLRLREEMAFGERFDLAHRDWSPEEGWELASSYAPLLFFLERYRQGCSLLETSLSFWFVGKKVRSYDILFHVYNGDEEPGHICRVTLTHFYTRLDKCLRDWRHWEEFVNGFHPRLLRLAGLRREVLLGDPTRLALFFDKLMDVRKERTTSGFTRGQADLIESPVKVRAWQAAEKGKLDQFKDGNKLMRERTDAKLLELFPDLNGLRR